MNHLTPLGEKDQQAIGLKYLGNSYADIANTVGVEYSTVKSWFMGSGRLYRPYIEYAAEASKDQKDTAKHLFAVSLDKAVRRITDLLDSDNERIRFAAAKEIIERHHLDEESVTLDELREVKVQDLMEAAKRLYWEDEERSSSLTKIESKI
jgi:hypothetical protein